MPLPDISGMSSHDRDRGKNKDALFSRIAVRSSTAYVLRLGIVPAYSQFQPIEIVKDYW